MNKRVIAVVLAGAMVTSQLVGPVEVLATNTAGEVEATTNETPEKVLEEGAGVDTPVETAKDNSVETQNAAKGWLKVDGKVYDVTGTPGAETAGTTEITGAGLDAVAHLIVGEAVTEIPDNLFKDKPTLTKVEIKDTTGVTPAANTTLLTIGTDAFKGTGLTTFKIPSKLTTIKAGAFDGTANLTTMDFAAATAVTTIEANAFRGTGFTTVTLPNTVTTIGNNAFENSALVSVEIPATVTTIGDGAFKGTTSLANADLSKAAALTEIKNSVFENSGVTSVTIPAKVTAIGGKAFSGATALTALDVTSAAALTSIGNDAFKGAAKLEGVVDLNPTKVTTIGKNAFEGTKITEIKFPTTLVSIDDSAFTGVESLAKVDFGTGTTFTTIGISAFEGTGLTTVTIPATVNSIGNSAFKNSKSLATVDLSAAALYTTIGGATFDGAGLTTVKIPATVTSIGESAFARNKKMTSVDFTASSGLLTVGESAFESSALTGELNLTGMTNAAIDIAVKAFKGNGLVTGVKLPAALTSLKAEVFAETGLTAIEITEKCIAVDGSALPVTLGTITAAAANAALSDEDGVLYNKNKSNLKLVPKAKAGEFTVPASVVTIEANAAKGNTQLTGVKLADSPALKDIEANAFGGTTALKKLDLRKADKLETVKGDAFKDSGLDYMYLGKATKDFTAGIVAGAFASAPTTKIVKFLEDNDAEITGSDLTTLEGTWTSLTTSDKGSWTFYRVPVKPATPNAQTDYDNMKLTGLTPSIGYKITVDGVETTVSSDANGKIDIKKEWGGKTIQIASVAAGNNLESDPQSLAISGIFTVTVDGAVEDTTIATKQITKTAPKKPGYTFKTWIAEGVTLTDPTAETITFEMPSSDVTLTTKYLQDTVAPVAVADYAEMKLTGLSPGAAYTIETEVLTADTDGKIAIKKEWSDKTISIKKNETDTEAESPEQSLVINKIYTISVNQVEFAISVDGQSVTVKAPAPEGQRFKVWTKVEGIAAPSDDEMKKESLTFTMPAADVKLTAEYTQIVTSKPEDMEYDGEKEVSVELDVPFEEFEDLMVNGEKLVKDKDYTVSEGPVATLASGKTIITFTKEYLDKLTVGESTTITAVLKGGNVDFSINVVEKPTVPEKPPVDFPDVNDKEWYAQAIDYVSSKEYMTGFADGKFGPADSLGRGQFASILHRMGGSPVESYNGIFTDVPDGTFYTMPVVWAHKNNVITGYEGGKFGPSDSMTREQLVTMLYRYTQIKGGNTVARASIDSFPDKAKVSGFATEAMQWAVAQNLVSGDNGNLNPQGIASRAVAATLIQRFEAKQKPEVTPPVTPPVTP